MSSKGLNQVDFAVAVAILVLLFAFTLRQVSGYYSPFMQTDDNVELRNRARNLASVAFNQEGVPGDWNHEEEFTRPSMGHSIWKVPVKVNNNGSGGTYTVTVPVEAGETHGRYNAWNESVLAYHNGEPLPTYLEGQGEGFIGSFDVTFEVDLGEEDQETVYIYYSQDRSVEVDYEDLGTEDHPANVTVFSERSERAVSREKAELMQEMDPEEIKNYYNIDHGFRMHFSAGEEVFVIGEEAPDGTDVETFSKSFLYQSENGTVDVVEPSVVVW